MFRTVLNRIKNKGSGLALFVTDEQLEDSVAIFNRSKQEDDGKTDKQTGETGQDDPEEGNNDEEEETEQIANLMVYDTIGKSFFGEGGIGESDILEGIKALGKNVKQIRVFINSPGGDSSVGTAIYNILTAHPAKVETVIDGIAASAASTIAMAGDNIVARTGSQMMIHNAALFTYGDAGDHEKNAEILHGFDASIASIYAEKTGIPVKEIRDLMASETWMTAAQAKSKGFVDEVRGRSAVKKQSVDNQSFVVAGGIRWASNLFPSMPQNLKSENKMPNAENPIRNSEDIKRLHPEVHQEIFNSGAKQERERIAELEKHSRPEVADIINAAKADGRKWVDVATECFHALSEAMENPSGKGKESNHENSGRNEFVAAGKAAVVNSAIKEGSEAADRAEKARKLKEEEAEDIKFFAKAANNFIRN